MQKCEKIKKDSKNHNSKTIDPTEFCLAPSEKVLETLACLKRKDIWKADQKKTARDWSQTESLTKTRENPKNHNKSEMEIFAGFITKGQNLEDWAKTQRQRLVCWYWLFLNDRQKTFIAQSSRLDLISAISTLRNWPF